ncbi:MAG TPA: aminoacyl-tRNA hydrolase [Pyrinomonadaceae bacterium]|nr:aminoacyl-tRNA hydrolase [Pyrinomonadaceae bacterium]
MIYLIFGLGNPGAEYARTRHNLGFMVIDKLAADDGIHISSRECRSLVGRGQLEGKAVKLIKPQTFMNVSGEAVSCFAAKHHLTMPAETLVVLSDDLALPVGKIRIRERGTAGGHNGLKSIIDALGTNDFVRVRMGIQPDHPISDAKRFVLDRFASGERELVEQMVEQAAKAVRTIVRDGGLKAMQEFN